MQICLFSAGNIICVLFGAGQRYMFLLEMLCIGFMYWIMLPRAEYTLVSIQSRPLPDRFRLNKYASG